MGVDVLEIDFSEKMLIAQDLSGVGDLSLTVALPILQVQKIPLAILPTSLLSTQSEGFETPATLYSQSFVAQTFAHWQAQKIKVTAALVGYIADLTIGNEIYNYLKNNSFKLIVIDPVFADEGNFYPKLDQKHIELQKKLINLADVTTPNITEARFLSGLKDETNLKKLVKAVEQLMPSEGKAVITGVELDGKKGCVWLENDELKTCLLSKLDGHFYGSGDVFSALLAGFLRKGVPFSQAVLQATTLTSEALEKTSEKKFERRYGIYLGELLPKLARGE